ncbi:hypothetical protein GCM10010145_41940 [Streptomyces ruber]|uniref:Uncharacterized protein n=2 Tax=Streptomyces TaxID=1883 RepID=A0A918BJ82_9ACTN|nr:hypothetical protein GCM10010145_41940 [Streptomyces ruber]
MFGAEDADDVEAVGPGHHDVEDEEVGGAVPDVFEGGEAVSDDGDRVALVFEVAAYEFGLFFVVFGDDDVCAHAIDRMGVREGAPRW